MEGGAALPGGLFQAVDDEGVGFVDGGGVEAGKVDAGGGLAVVAHAFGDDGEGYAVGFGGGRPAVARHIEGQGY